MLWLAKRRRFTVESEVFAVSLGTVVVDAPRPRVTTDQRLPVNAARIQTAMRRVDERSRPTCYTLSDLIQGSTLITGYTG